MVKRQGMNPQKRSIRRIQKTPDNEKPVVQAKQVKPFLAAGRMLHKLHVALRALVRGFVLKLRPAKRAAHARRSLRAARRLRYTVLVSGAAVAAVVLLLVLLAPGGTAAPASGPSSASQVVAAASASTPLPTTDPDLVIAPIATTEPDAATAATPTQAPTQTLAPTQKPTATPTQAPSSNPDMAELVAYYRVDADSYYSDFHYSSNHYDYTDEELIMLAQVIQREAGGEPDKGKIAVGNVVINRTLCGHWGSTIADQLGGLAYNPDIVPRQSCLDAAHAVLDDEVWVVPQNTYNFKTSGGDWRTFTYWGQIGHHHFYTYHYGDRYTGGSLPPALFDRVFKYAQYGCKPAERVKRIQYMLQSLGYNVTPDKYFGKSTEEALVAFQTDRGLASDGVAGPATVEALIRAFGVENYCNQYL